MKGCYGKGGKIRPKSIHGLRTGQHNNPNVLRAARASGGSCEVKQVDGKKPPMRMDRPMRASGGRANMDSGGVPGDVGSNEGTQQAYLRTKASKLRDDSTGDFKSAAMNAGVTAFNAFGPRFKGKFKTPKNLAADTAAAGTATLGIRDFANGMAKREQANTADNEAESFNKTAAAKNDIEGDLKKREEDREGRKNGGPLNAEKRNALPTKSFAGPDRSYPINDPNHARNALARVANKSPALKARVKAKVHAKYPGIGEGE